MLPIITARHRCRIACVLLGIFLSLVASRAVAQGVAIVTDVSGRVTGQPPVTIMSEIAADARVQIDASGRLVVIYLKSGDEYAFAGPSHIQFRAAEPQV